MSEDKKDFYKITELSEWFHEWQQNEKEPTAVKCLVWQSRFQLAIVQQLAMIAKHLGKIVGKAEERNGKD